MENKDKIKVLFGTDENGYILGYQQEFYDGKKWVAPFDTSKAVEVAPADLASVALGASKVSADGTITTDADKKAELEAEANKVIPSAEQLVINQLGLTIAELQNQVKELGGNA